MLSRIAGAGLMAALMFTGPSVFAADLSGDPYDDPRYAEIYRDAPPPVSRYVERERYEERYGENGHGDKYGHNGGHGDKYGHGEKYGHGDKHGHDDYSKYDSLKDGHDKYANGHDKYANGDDYGEDRYGGGKCIPRHLIRRELKGEGWRDFEDLSIRGEYVLLKARRPSGRLFDLKIDRCSGDIVRARPCDSEYYNQYAYGPRKFWRY